MTSPVGSVETNPSSRTGQRPITVGMNCKHEAMVRVEGSLWRCVRCQARLLLAGQPPTSSREPLPVEPPPSTRPTVFHRIP